MAIKYAIQYNSNLSIITGKDRFDSIEDAEQNLLNNGYHLIENNIHQKFWATLDFSNNRFRIENIEIIEIREYTPTEVAEKILLALLNQEYMPILNNVSGCQNCITLKINDQMFRILVKRD